MHDIESLEFTTTPMIKKWVVDKLPDQRVVHNNFCKEEIAKIIPIGRALDRSQQGLWLDLGQVPKIVFQHALLDGHLGSRVEVLHLATTASPLVQTEVRAAWRHTLRGLAVNVCDGALFPAVFLSADLDLNQLTRQCAFNENHRLS